MSDCECEKNKAGDNWVEDGDYGDEYLREESFNVIDKIKRGLTYYGFNENAIFNKKMGQRQIENMDLDEVNVDYSYLNDKEEIDLLEETMEEEYLQNREESPILEEVSDVEEEVTPSEIDMVLKEEEPDMIEEVSEVEEEPDMIEEVSEVEDEPVNKRRIPTSKIVTDKEIDEILKDDLI